MKNKLFTLAAALMLAAVIGGVYAAPALAAVIKAALVKNVDERGRVPYTMADFCTGQFQTCTVTFPPVPADKRLVIEHVSGFIFLGNPSATVDQFSLNVGGQGRNYSHAQFNGDSSSSSGTNTFSVSDPVLVYAEPLQQVSVVMTWNETGFGQLSAVISGYLVDLTI